MSKYTITEVIAEISATGQVIPTEKLLKWLENFDFEMRTKTGGSHIFTSHKTETDIYDTLIRNTVKLDTQRAVRVMLQELNKRRIKLSQEFGEASLSPQCIAETLEQKIPADLTYRLTESGNIVLTDRTYPQVGITFAQKDVRLAENKVRQLTTAKRDYGATLGRLVSQYDMNSPAITDGVFDGRLTHHIYSDMPEKQLPLYEEGDDIYLAKAELEVYQNNIENIDRAHLERKSQALERINAPQPLITCAGRRGERHNHVSYTNEGGKTLHFTFNTFSNQRLTFDGKTARISSAELEKLERIVSGISASSERHYQAA